jgi:signal transduction histidine kinase/CheY-like chemotaxis protein
MGVALYMGVDSRRKAQRLHLFNLRLQDEMALRDRAEKVTSETEAELVKTLNSLPVHVWSAKVAADGQYVPRRMSTVLAGISGRPADFFDGSVSSWLQIVHPDDVPMLRNVVEDILSGRKETVDFEYQLVRTDGSIRYMSDSIRTTHIESGRRLDGVSRDVTEVRESQEERLRLESRFQQSQRLDSLGVLAGGVAHDFNNLLVAMLGHARLAEEDLPADSPVHHNLKSVIKAARQAGDLCGQMLAYAGKVPIDTQSIELENVVQEIGDLLRASIPSSTSIRYGFDKEVPCIQADAIQIRQVVLNLITNASESIRETGGEIMLSVRSLECETVDFSKMTLFENLEPGQYVVLTVSDTGSGMDEETRAKLFEPFYTTKFAGRGLGLAAVAGIVRGHRGAIRIESEVDRGSTISVLFPAGTQDAMSRTNPSRLDLSVRKENGKVLLVEDENAARELARIVLERAGIEVVEASDGVEAIAIFQAQPDEFNRVLLDLTMPRMDGVETYSRLRKIRADVQVVLCSGYPEQAAMARFADLGLAGFLKKPYEPEQLLDCLECIAEPGDSA